MITMWGLFRTFRQASDLVGALQRLSLPGDSINVLVPEGSARGRQPATGTDPSTLAATPQPGLRTMLAGGESGGPASGGGLLAVGPLARTLAHAAAEGTLEHGLLTAGLSPAYAGFYLQGLKSGALLVAATLDDGQERMAVSLYRQSGAEFLAGLPLLNPGELPAADRVAAPRPAGLPAGGGTEREERRPDSAPTAPTGRGHRPSGGPQTRGAKADQASHRPQPGKDARHHAPAKRAEQRGAAGKDSAGPTGQQPGDPRPATGSSESGTKGGESASGAERRSKSGGRAGTGGARTHGRKRPEGGPAGGTTSQPQTGNRRKPQRGPNTPKTGS